MTRTFESLEGRSVDFYGVDNNVFCIGLDGERFAFEAVEDEDDGYRSRLEELKRVPLKGHIFFQTPITRVVIEKAPHLDGWALRQARGKHVWLYVGTDRPDDWYPCFHFEYTPMQGAV